MALTVLRDQGPQSPRDWVRLSGCRHAADLAVWELAVKRDNAWQITEDGERWLNGEFKAPRHAIMWRGSLIGMSRDDGVTPDEIDEGFNIRVATGERYNPERPQTGLI